MGVGAAAALPRPPLLVGAGASGIASSSFFAFLGAGDLDAVLAPRPLFFAGEGDLAGVGDLAAALPRRPAAVFLAGEADRSGELSA